MDNHTTETFCYETRCEFNLMKRYCVSYSDKELHPASKELPGFLECKSFRLKTKKKKTDASNASLATPQAVTKDALCKITKSLKGTKP